MNVKSIDELLSLARKRPTVQRAPEEFIVDKELETKPFTPVRQAGSEPAMSSKEGPWVQSRRQLAEQSLYYFCKAILKRRYLSTSLHLPSCNWLQTFPPNKKLWLMPRETAKTSIVSHGLPLHVQIQPAESNAYFSGERGEDQRVLLICETDRLSKGNLRVVRRTLEGNRLLRAFWPHRVWHTKTGKGPHAWNDIDLILPRETEYNDPSICALGVGAAIAGKHPSMLVKDDMISYEAANSRVVMDDTISYHYASRALVNKPTALEFIIGTRWAVHDLYSEIMENDKSVAVVVRSIVEDGKSIYPPPEGPFTWSKIMDLKTGPEGIWFPLLYMNNPRDSTLTEIDFDSLRRTFRIENGEIVFDEDERDMLLAERAGAVPQRQGGTDSSLDGLPLTPDMDVLKERITNLRHVHTS